ncbi:MAG: hypothetical protein ABIM96_03455, partial [Candidatus Saccharimonas sp.]
MTQTIPGTTPPQTPSLDPAHEYVGIVTTIRGLTVEIQLVSARPDLKELLLIEEHPEVFIEVNFFRGSKAVCLNLNNNPTVRCGQKIYRTHTKVTVPVGAATLGRV